MLVLEGEMNGKPIALHQREFLNRKEAARYLTVRGYDIEGKTLANWAANGNAGDGPPFERLRWNLVRYRRADLDNWLARRPVRVG